MTKREARILLAASAWTLYVWVSRLVIMAGGDESVGFKVVHTLLAAVSLGFAVAIGRMGLRYLRRGRLDDPGRRENAPVP